MFPLESVMVISLFSFRFEITSRSFAYCPELDELLTPERPDSKTTYEIKNNRQKKALLSSYLNRLFIVSRTPDPALTLRLCECLYVYFETCERCLVNRSSGNWSILIIQERTVLLALVINIHHEIEVFLVNRVLDLVFLNQFFV